MSAPERELLLEQQKGRCKLCEVAIKFDGVTNGNSACIDHCHSTGRVRGILCHNCNTMVGYLENRNWDLDQVKRYLAPVA